MDLEPAWDLKQAAGASAVSAQTGQGVAELCQAISTRLVPDPPPPGAAVPFASSLCSDIEEANRLCAQGHLQDAYECLRRTADATL